MRKINIIITLFCLCVTVIFVSCRPKNQQDLDYNNNDPMVYDTSIISDTISADISDQTDLYPVTDDFLEDFLERVAEYEGKHITIATKMPVEWGVSCVERLPEGRELWLLRSVDREWAYLVITSGFGTQRILDMVPVALNLAQQDNDVLETEIWETYRESDGSFVVHKNYEWIKNLDTNATQSDLSEYQRHSYFVDRYTINDLCRFECTAVNDSVPEYSAVVFFYKENVKPEEWDDVIEMLQAFCEDRNVYYEEVKAGFADVAVHDFTLNEVTHVDLRPYIQDLPAGMVMFKKGETPKAVRFGSFERMQIEIKRYFKMLSL